MGSESEDALSMEEDQDMVDQEQETGREKEQEKEAGRQEEEEEEEEDVVTAGQAVIEARSLRRRGAPVSYRNPSSWRSR
jgi:hypothetical protein